MFKINQVHKMNRVIEVNTGGVPLKALIDLGASCNIVDEKTWSQLKKNKIRCKTSASDGGIKLFSYAAINPLPIKGRFWCLVSLEGDSTEVEFLVVKGRGAPLIGEEMAVKLGVISFHCGVAAITVSRLSDKLQNSTPLCFRELAS